eukprot:249256-Alexandrium_andersonii.AAC.1
MATWSGPQRLAQAMTSSLNWSTLPRSTWKTARSVMGCGCGPCSTLCDASGTCAPAAKTSAVTSTTGLVGCGDGGR